MDNQYRSKTTHRILADKAARERRAQQDHQQHPVGRTLADVMNLQGKQMLGTGSAAVRCSQQLFQAHQDVIRLANSANMEVDVERCYQELQTIAHQLREGVVSATYARSPSGLHQGFPQSLDDELYFHLNRQTALSILSAIIQEPFDLRKKQERHSPINHRRKTEFLEDMTRTFFARREGGIIVPLRPIPFEQREERSQSLRVYGDVYCLKHAPYACLKIDYAEEERIISQITKKQSIPKPITKSHIVYLPEVRTACVDQRLHVVRLKATGRNMWNLQNIGAYAAQETTKGAGSLVAIVDTGVDYTHSEVAGRFLAEDRGWNFIDNNNEVMDQHMHGTHVSGTVAGEEVGVAPQVRLLAYVVLGKDGYGNGIDSIRALDLCIDKKVNVVNYSLGSPTFSSAFAELCIAAHRKGVFIAAAAGNESSESYSYPASYEGVLSIAAVDRDNAWAYFSNTNDQVDLAGPGIDILSCVPGGYASLAGTSMATPHVTGSLALLTGFLKRPFKEMEELIEQSAQQLSYDKEKVGWGLVRPDLALARGGNSSRSYTQSHRQLFDGVYQKHGMLSAV
jgi:hypothetical protein